MSSPTFLRRLRPRVTVSELTAEINDLLETSFTDVWVSGEVSNLSRRAPGTAISRSRTSRRN